MENIIWILIIFWVIQRIMARAGKNSPFPGPFPGPMERMPRDSAPEGDYPLPGPWNPVPGQETPVDDDAPLSGPWDQETRETNARDDDTGGREYTRPGKETTVQSEPVPSVDVPEPEVQTQERKQTEFNQPKVNQRREIKTDRRADKSFSHQNVPPLYRLLNNRQGLAASVIVNEVFNRRGGRNAGRFK